MGLLKASIKGVFGWIRRLGGVAGRVGAPETEVAVLVQAMVAAAQRRQGMLPDQRTPKG